MVFVSKVKNTLKLVSLFPICSQFLNFGALNSQLKYSTRCYSVTKFLKSYRFFSDNKIPLIQQSLQNKKRYTKRKKISDIDGNSFWVTAYSTAEEYNLEKLLLALEESSSFKPTSFSYEFGKLTDFIHAVGSSDPEQEHLFIFREGSVVMWNVLESDMTKILNLLKNFEENSFLDDVVKSENEVMPYVYSYDVNKTTIVNDCIVFLANSDLKLEKYAISNAMALSVHLGTFEANLEKYIDTMEPVTEDLKSGEEIKMSRKEVLKKTGQLFALRHNITLSSDLLDTPDFYWDRPELERLYHATFNYFCINKRTKVMNEKINHCIELVQLLSDHLNDKHHIRLEWMIIILIMVEVVFEIIHYVEMYFEKNESHQALVSKNQQSLNQHI